MDEGRRWALETFGAYGPKVRGDVKNLVQEEHVASLDAQEASGHRSRSVYGQFWRGILERFEPFSALPDAELVRPGEAPYKIPVVSGIALFPWRYTGSREAQLQTTRFGISESRLAITSLRPPPTQEALPINMPDTGLTEDEQRLLDTFEAVTSDPVVTSGRLVLVAISSSVRGLFSAEWGEVALDSDGCLDWIGFHESLLSPQLARPASASPTTTFTSGAVPNKFPHTQDDTGPVQR